MSSTDATNAPPVDAQTAAKDPVGNASREAAAGEKNSVHNLNSMAAYNEAKEAGGVMVIDCFATWCGPCKVIAPQLVKMAEKYDTAKFFKIDVDEVPDLAQHLAVRAMPTFFVFKDGQQVGEVVGANPGALETAIKNAV